MIFRRDGHPVRVCPPTLALAGDQMHAGRPFTGCTLRPLTGQGFAPRHAAGSPVTRGSGTGSCHRPGRPAAITRYIAPVMAALAIYAVTAALLKDRTDTQAPPPATPDQAPPENPGMIPLTVPEIRRLLAAALQRPSRPATPRTG